MLTSLVRDTDETMTDEEVASTAIVQLTLYIATQVSHVVLRLVSDVDRAERFRLTLRFFDDVSTAS